MTKGERTRLVWGIGATSLLWMVLGGFFLFVMFGVEPVNHSSPEVKDRMAAECFGSFKDRFDCKEAIIVQSGRDTFWAMSWRFLLVIVPPTLSSFWLSSHLRRHPIQQEHHHVDNGEDWKSRAQFHTQQQSPEQAGQDLRVDGVSPLHPASPHPIQSIAPVPDWKSRAQSQIAKAKRPE